MKAAITKHLLYTLFTLLIFSSISCKNTKSEEKTSETKIPKLLDRTSKLGSEQEEKMIKDTYAKLVEEIKITPKKEEPKLQLAELFMMEARITGDHPYYYPAALKMVDQVIKPELKDKNILFNALSLKSSVMLSLHQFQEGLDLANEAVKINPMNAGIYGAIIDANVELGNYDKAVEMADKMVSIRPDLRSYSRISYLREIHGEVEGAKEAMDMAVKAGYPGYETTAWSRVILGSIFENYGDLTTAEMHYNITLEERPDYPFALEGLARIEMKKGNLEKAEKMYSNATTIIPEIAFYEGLAGLYKKQGKDEKAKEIALKIVEMMKEDEASGHKMDLEKAKIYLNYLANNEKALECAMNEYKARPNNIEVNLLLAKIMLAQGDYNKATNYLNVASSTNSKNPDLILCKGILASGKGNEQEAQKLFKEALNSNPYMEGAMVDQAKNSLSKI